MQFVLKINLLKSVRSTLICAACSKKNQFKAVTCSITEKIIKKIMLNKNYRRCCWSTDQMQIITHVRI